MFCSRDILKRKIGRKKANLFHFSSSDCARIGNLLPVLTTVDSLMKNSFVIHMIFIGNGIYLGLSEMIIGNLQEWCK